jgi:Ca2+-binding RTX toxin-like protein
LFHGQAIVDQFSARVTDEYGVSNFRPMSISVVGTGEPPPPGPMTFTGSAANELFTGSSSDDQFTGGGGNDFLVGLGGSDTFIYHSASEGVDTIVDFTPGAGGDTIDIRDVLAGYTPGVSNIADFVQTTEFAGNSTLRVDANGPVGGANFSDLATLQGVTGLVLQNMLDNHNLVVS